MLDNSEIINILSFLLPFSNEVANVLTSSGLPLFKNLYKQCIDGYLIDSKFIKYIPKDKICQDRHVISKLIIDLIALTGIILNIGKNSIRYNYLTGILSGLSIIILSFIVPNLFLHKTIHYFMNLFKTKNPFIIILIGFTLIAILLGLSVVIEKFIQHVARGVIIDPGLHNFPLQR